GFLKLSEAATLRFAVGPPADELRSVPEPGAFHVVVADLDDALGPQRDEREVFAGVPAAVLGLARMTSTRGGLWHPVPRMAVEGGDQRLQLGVQGLALGERERADDADAGQVAVLVVKPKQQRSDRLRAALVYPVPGDHAVRGPLVLDLEHRPLVR